MHVNFELPWFVTNMKLKIAISLFKWFWKKNSFSFLSLILKSNSPNAYDSELSSLKPTTLKNFGAQVNWFSSSTSSLKIIINKNCNILIH